MATKRSPYDFYPTPVWCVEALLEKCELGHTVLEPCAGDGVIVSTICKRYRADWGFGIDANEIDEAHSAALNNCGADHVYYRDYLAFTKDDLKWYDTIITNPPFSLAQEILEHTFTNAKPGTQVIMLLRLNFLASQKRHEFWKKYPPQHLYVLSKRPSFTGTGTDSQDYAWFMWRIGDQNSPIEVIQ